MQRRRLVRVITDFFIVCAVVLPGWRVSTLRAADCNGNGMDDADDIAQGVSLDCNANGIPDECDIEAIELAALTADDGAMYDRFGSSLAVDGDTAVIGDYTDDDLGSNAGAAYVYQRVDGALQQVAKLTADDALPSDQFGWSVAISGDDILIGATGVNDVEFGNGATYVFQNVAGTWLQVAKLTAPEAVDGDVFGSAIDIDGDTAIVGSQLGYQNNPSSGTAYVFRQSGGVWQQVAELTASDGQPSDNFGEAVAIDGTTVIVGASGNDEFGSSSGAAYIFQESGGNWQQVTKLHASDASIVDGFGTAVAINGNSAVIGANLADGARPQSGAAYVFRESAGLWQETAKLVADDGALLEGLGSSVTMDDATIVVGAPNESAWMQDYRGAAYVFREVDGGWRQIAKLTASDAVASGLFGKVLSISGDTLLVGAQRGSTSNTATAYVFNVSLSSTDCNGNDRPDECDIADGISEDCNGNGVPDSCDIASGAISDCNANGVPDDCDLADGTLGDCNGNGIPDICPADTFAPEEIVKMTDSHIFARGLLGNSLAISGDTAVAGVPMADDACLSIPQCNAGAASVFRRIDNVWQQVAYLTASDAAADDNFGTAVAIRGDLIVVGAPNDDDAGESSGSAYVFREADGVWQEVTKLTADDAGIDDRFGASIAIGVDTIFVTAINEGNNHFRGAVYVFRKINGGWQQVDKLISSIDFEYGFGDDLAFAQGTLLIGTYYDYNEMDMTNPAAAYVYRELGGVWQQVARLEPITDSSKDGFGHAVATTGDVAVVGAYLDDATCGAYPNCGAGTAFVFREVNGVWRQVAYLTPTDSNMYQAFGNDVAISGGTILIGAAGDNPAGVAQSAGSVYVYQDVGGFWQQVAKLTPSDAVYQDEFGISVALHGDTAIIGAVEGDHSPIALPESGAAYVFDIDGDSNDCNANGTLDECDIAAGTSPDCNLDGVIDDCEIAEGLVKDCNGNGIPDNCETPLGSIDAFVAAILSQSQQTFDLCVYDADGSGALDGRDIEGVVARWLEP